MKLKRDSVLRTKVSVIEPNLVDDALEQKNNLETVPAIRPKFGSGIGNVQLFDLKKVTFSRKVAYFGTQKLCLYEHVRNESQ